MSTNLLPGATRTNPPSFAQDIRDIRGPVSLGRDWRWVGWSLLLVLAAVAAWFWWRRWRKKKAAPAQLPARPAIPPHIRAYARLEEALALIDEPRPFCILVSDAIRIYLEEQFTFKAPERTTEEFLEEMQASALLSFEQKRALGQFLMSCDLVKFARHHPARPALQDIHDTARRLVDETQPAAPAPGPLETHPGLEAPAPGPTISAPR